MSVAPQKKKLPLLQLVGLVVSAAIMVSFTVLGILWMLSLRSPERLAAFQMQIESLGPGGWFLLLAIQYIQIVIAFIPGGPIQIVAGALYGPLGGLSICLLGTVLATATVYALVHRFGRRVISLFVEDRDISRYRFLNDSRKLEWLVLVLFFIPGTPKDALTYLFALTPLPMRRFLVLSTCARLPAMLTSVLAGDSVVQGEWMKAGVLFLAISLISMGGLLLHRKLGRWMGREDRDRHRR